MTVLRLAERLLLITLITLFQKFERKCTSRWLLGCYIPNKQTNCEPVHSPQQRNKKNVSEGISILKSTIKTLKQTPLTFFWDFDCGLWTSPLFEKCKFFTVGLYLFKVNNKNSRSMCENCPKLTIKAVFHSAKKSEQTENSAKIFLSAYAV